MSHFWEIYLNLKPASLDTRGSGWDGIKGDQLEFILTVQTCSVLQINPEVLITPILSLSASLQTRTYMYTNHRLPSQARRAGLAICGGIVWGSRDLHRRGTCQKDRGRFWRV